MSVQNRRGKNGRNSLPTRKIRKMTFSVAFFADIYVNSFILMSSTTYKKLSEKISEKSGLAIITGHYLWVSTGVSTSNNYLVDNVNIKR